jgi:hypothetical protein
VPDGCGVRGNKLLNLSSKIILLPSFVFLIEAMELRALD